jgi:hypothetical protein
MAPFSLHILFIFCRYSYNSVNYFHINVVFMTVKILIINKMSKMSKIKVK